MKKHNILCIAFLLFATSAQALTPKRCIEGDVWEIDDLGDPQLVSCAKWERDPAGVVAEREAINNAYNDETEAAFKAGNYEVINHKEDETPLLGKAQNKLNELSSDTLGKLQK